MEHSVLDDLQANLDFAIAKMAEMQRENKLLREEIKKLSAKIAEQEKYIQLLEQKSTSKTSEPNDAQLKAYQETEEKVRKKISEMLAKLDALSSADDR